MLLAASSDANTTSESTATPKTTEHPRYRRLATQMEKWRVNTIRDGSTSAVTGWTVTWDPEPFVRELADEVLEVLRDPAARAYVSLVVHAAMLDEWGEHLKLDPGADQKLAETLNGRDVQRLKREERREILLANGFGGDHYAKKGWCFPILHGIDSPPGYYLVLAGLNELAVADPQGFDPRHEPIGPMDNSGPALCFMPYKTGWELVRAKHVVTLRAVFAATRADLNVQTSCASSVTSKRKRGRPADTDFAEDKRVWEAWQSETHNSKLELARALGTGWTKKKVEDAIERHRKRSERS